MRESTRAGRFSSRHSLTPQNLPVRLPQLRRKESTAERERERGKGIGSGGGRSNRDPEERVVLSFFYGGERLLRRACSEASLLLCRF